MAGPKMSLQRAVDRVISRESTVSDNAAEPVEFWIAIERQYNADVIIGPYGSEDAADSVLQSAPIIDSITEEDSLEAYVVRGRPEGEWEVITPDPSDPDFYA